MQDNTQNVYENPMASSAADGKDRRPQSGGEQSNNTKILKGAAIIVVVLLLVSFFTNVGLYVQQKSEREKALAFHEQKYYESEKSFDESRRKLETLDNKTEDLNAGARQNYQELSKRLDLMASEVDEIKQIHQVFTKYANCSGVNLASAKFTDETGGVYNIDIPRVGTKEVYCNTKTDGGDWIVFQRRMYGGVDFHRYWNNYVAGFGQAGGEYWLGLEALYQLTKNGNVELRIDMIAHDGTFYYAKYSNFKVGPATDNYRLTVSGYSGNSTDSMTYHNNQLFTTRDRDNDKHTGLNCADFAHHASGWWYNACVMSSLNGIYNRRDWKGIVWRDRNNKDNRMWMKFAEMKLRQKN